jgi:two-component system, OmpR family, alkaline phosphatase synthesis response regulator PhoP
MSKWSVGGSSPIDDLRFLIDEATASTRSLRQSSIKNRKLIKGFTTKMSMILAQIDENSYNTTMTTQRILMVDDDKEIVRVVRGYLEQAGYEVLVAYDGEAALYVLRSAHPDLLLLDLMLPQRDGWELTRIIRSDAALANIPIIMLTARIEDTDKILGLELGADDYVTKPFNPREVLARVRAQLRRNQHLSAATLPQLLQVGKLRMDVERREVRVADEFVELTRTEFSLLQAFMQNPGYVFTRSELIEKALGYNYESIERTLDTHIKNLRRKIGDDPKQPTAIQTVYGVGYRLVETS